MVNKLKIEYEEFLRQEEIRKRPFFGWKPGFVTSIIINIVIMLGYIEYLRSVVSGI